MPSSKATALGRPPTLACYLNATYSDHYSFTNTTATSYDTSASSFYSSMSNGTIVNGTSMNSTIQSYTWSSSGTADEYDSDSGSLGDETNTESGGDSIGTTWSTLSTINGAGSLVYSTGSSSVGDAMSNTQPNAGSDTEATSVAGTTTVTTYPNNSTTVYYGGSARTYNDSVTAGTSAFSNLDEQASDVGGSGLASSLFNAAASSFHAWQDAFPATYNAAMQGDTLGAIDGSTTILLGATTKSILSSMISGPVNDAVSLAYLGTSIDQNFAEKKAKEAAFWNIEYAQGNQFDPNKLKPTLNQGVVNGLSTALSWTAQTTAFGAGGFNFVSLHAPVQFNSTLEATLAAKESAAANETAAFRLFMAQKPHKCFVAGTQVLLAADPQGGDAQTADAVDAALAEWLAACDARFIALAAAGIAFGLAGWYLIKRAERQTEEGRSADDGSPEQAIEGEQPIGTASSVETVAADHDAIHVAHGYPMATAGSLACASRESAMLVIEPPQPPAAFQQPRSATRPSAPKCPGAPPPAARWWLVLWCALSLAAAWKAVPTRTTDPRPAPPTAEQRTKNIEAIRKGDRVLAMDPASGRLVARPVLQTYRRETDRLRVLRIRTSDGQVQELKTTDEHPFWVPNTGWVEAGKLHRGDPLLQADGSVGRLETTAVERRTKGVPVYNFQVEEDHDYFVSQSRQRSQVLVHNANPGYGFIGGNVPNGNWVPESTTGWSDRAKAYQEQITGMPAGQAYEVNGVRFDGPDPSGHGLVDAKGPGYATAVKNGQFVDWYRGAGRLIDEANRQVAAANGAKITWHVAEADAATAISNLLQDEGITGIQVVHTPPTVP